MPDIAMATPTTRPGVRIEHHGRAERSGGATLAGHSAVELSGVEVSRLISAKLAGKLDMVPPIVRVGLRAGEPAEVALTTPLRTVLAVSLLAGIANALPARWLDRPVWLDVRVSPRLEQGGSDGRRRYLVLELRQFAVGRQSLPVVAARLVEPQTLDVLRWALPDDVESVTVETDRVLVRLVS
jgi:hypothetical protein